MKNHCEESVGFSFRAAVVSVAGSEVWLMILFAFLSCFLVFFFVKDQIASFQLKQIIVFLNLVLRVCVYFIAWLRPSLIIEFSTTGSELFGMQLIVWMLTWIMIEKNKAMLYHADISKWYLSVCHLKIVFYFLHELKQRSRSSDITGWH